MDAGGAAVAGPDAADNSPDPSASKSSWSGLLRRRHRRIAKLSVSDRSCGAGRREGVSAGGKARAREGALPRADAQLYRSTRLPPWPVWKGSDVELKQTPSSCLSEVLASRVRCGKGEARKVHVLSSTRTGWPPFVARARPTRVQPTDGQPPRPPSASSRARPSHPSPSEPI
jgi:hypothetical protein